MGIAAGADANRETGGIGGSVEGEVGLDPAYAISGSGGGKNACADC